MSMKITSTIARYLLGLIFVTFGLNGFLHFIPMPPPTGVAAQFFGALFVSRFYVVIFLLQIMPAVLLLASLGKTARHQRHLLRRLGRRRGQLRVLAARTRRGSFSCQPEARP